MKFSLINPLILKINKIAIIMACLLIFISFQKQSLAQNPTSDTIISNKVENLICFAKLYGYTRYFYPDDNEELINWDLFAVYGTSIAMNCNSQKQLKDSLQILFQIVSPKSKLYYGGIKNCAKELKHKRKWCFKRKYYQHYGLGDLNSSFSEYFPSSKLSFKSVIVKSRKQKIFKQSPRHKHIIKSKLSDSIYCTIPLSLCNNSNKSSNNYIDSLLYDLAKEVNQKVSLDDQNTKLANIIITWNIIQHFYPYNISDDWNHVLNKSLNAVIQTDNNDDFIQILKEMLIPLNDGHCRVLNKNDTKHYYHPPFALKWIAEKAVVTKSFNDKIKAGDILTQIDDELVSDLFEKETSVLSGSRQYKKMVASQLLCTSRFSHNSNFAFSRNDSLFEQVLEWKKYPAEDYHSDNRDTLKKINGVWYINIGKASFELIKKNIDSLCNAKSIIIDLRDYPLNNSSILTHFIDRKVLKNKWMYIPEVIYPDNKEIEYANNGWDLKPSSKRFKGKVVVLINAESISYAESIIGYCDADPKVTLIGEPTAGANGTVNPFVLPGNVEVWWSSIKVLKHNGDNLHSIGFIPDILVTPTIEDVKEGKDTILEAALNYIQNR